MSVIQLDNTDEIIDDLLFKFYDLFDEIINLSNFLENNIRNGWVNLSKAKYTMGSCERVSKLQYNWQQMEVEEATCKVEITSDEIYGMNVEQLNRIQTLKIKVDKSKSNNDPIKWFGYLTPQCLKDSQKDFQRAINISLELASKKLILSALQINIQNKINSRKI